MSRAHSPKPAFPQSTWSWKSLRASSEDALGLLLELKKLGISLSIDDFGTGYSSLSYLRRLPIDKLKIDQSFIRDIPNDASAISIARAIILLSQSLGFSVIAEGVETKEQLEVLQALGCDKIQGYYFSKPVTDEELPRVRDDIQRKLNARARDVTIDWPHEAACRTA